ncbi:hypothetical protein CALCODRAFT_193546 [Calocera cornea HHB12733]|uniref:Uncharacterized protein n=1 Tax=Calocera cornea HHB12733 TaxID=1353952 RepID=A0A165C6U2_9BASI|nr:hypothetical protein CALCODRAFT_193546 [Calocera cornea HHB12733]
MRFWKEPGTVGSHYLPQPCRSLIHVTASRRPRAAAQATVGLFIGRWRWVRTSFIGQLVDDWCALLSLRMPALSHTPCRCAVQLGSPTHERQVDASQELISQPGMIAPSLVAPGPSVKGATGAIPSELASSSF